jgi:hypothetical protein
MTRPARRIANPLTQATSVIEDADYSTVTDFARLRG